METETLRAVRRALRWLKKAERLLAKDVAKMKAPKQQDKGSRHVPAENEWAEQP